MAESIRKQRASARVKAVYSFNWSGIGSTVKTIKNDENVSEGDLTAPVLFAK